MSILHMTIHSQSMAFFKKITKRDTGTVLQHICIIHYGATSLFLAVQEPPPPKKKPKKRFVWPKRIWVTLREIVLVVGQSTGK